MKKSYVVGIISQKSVRQKGLSARPPASALQSKTGSQKDPQGLNATGATF